MRTRAKHFVEATLLASGVPALLRRRRAGATVILAYHNIVPTGEAIVGERALHVTQEQFSRQLDLLAGTHDVIPLQEVVDSKPRSGRPRAAITWDDAYLGTVTAGVAEVARRGLPATIFVCPGRLGGHAFWWDRMAEQGGGTIPAELRQRALEEWEGDEALVEERMGAAASPAARLPLHARTASEQDLARAAATPGISFGAHSWSHPNLAQVPPPRLLRELVETKEWLESRFPSACPWLAYPYGVESDAVRKATREAGYRGGCLIRGGWIRDPAPDPYRLPRLHVPAGLSLRGFELRMAGLFC